MYGGGKCCGGGQDGSKSEFMGGSWRCLGITVEVWGLVAVLLYLVYTKINNIAIKHKVVQTIATIKTVDDGFSSIFSSIFLQRISS